MSLLASLDLCGIGSAVDDVAKTLSPRAKVVNRTMVNACKIWKVNGKDQVVGEVELTKWGCTGVSKTILSGTYVSYNPPCKAPIMPLLSYVDSHVEMQLATPSADGGLELT